MFLLTDVLKVARYDNLPGFADLTPDLALAALAEAAKLCERVLQPLNQSGDQEGCARHEDGRVTAPKGFKEAYRQYATGVGWASRHRPNMADKASRPSHRGGQ